MLYVQRTDPRARLRETKASHNTMPRVSLSSSNKSSLWMRRLVWLALGVGALHQLTVSRRGNLLDIPSLLLFDTTSSNHDDETTEASGSADGNPSEEPLNIVLFYADDWTFKVLGKVNPEVQTPNIDALADDGLLFENNFVTTSICWISRATLMTGQYASVHRQQNPIQHNLFNHWNDTLFVQLKNAGYYTGLVGKWHAPGDRQYMSKAFDYQNLYYGQHWMSRNGRRRHVTDLNGEDALHFLEQRPDEQKFALKVSFFATHAVDGKYPSYQPMNESMSLYQDVDIPPPQTATHLHWQELPFFFTEQNEGRRRWTRRFEPDYYGDNIRDLYRLATEVDAVVGAVVDKLREQNVLDTTLIMFTTDNGNLHGEHGMAEKWYSFEESIRVPLVVWDPRMPMKVRGTREDSMTLNVDLAPTILSATGIAPPARMQGRDMAQLYLNRASVQKEWRTDFFYEWNTGDIKTAQGHMFPKVFIPAVFALVNLQWKYVVWPEHNYEQLFHVENDRYEEFDLMHLEKYNRTVTVSTNDGVLRAMKERYAASMEIAQSGAKI